MAEIVLTESELKYVIIQKMGIDISETDIVSIRTEVEESLKEKALLKMNFSGDRILDSELARLLSMFQLQCHIELVVRKPDEDIAKEKSYYTDRNHLYCFETLDDGMYRLSDKDYKVYLDEIKIPAFRKCNDKPVAGAVKTDELRKVKKQLEGTELSECVQMLSKLGMPEKTAENVIGAMKKKNGLYSILFENREEGQEKIETVTFIIGDTYLRIDNTPVIGEEEMMRYIPMEREEAESLVKQLSAAADLDLENMAV